MSHTLPEGQNQQVAELSVTIDSRSTVVSSDVIKKFIFLGQVSETTNLFHLKETYRQKMEKILQLTEEKFVYLRYWKNIETFLICRILTTVYYEGFWIFWVFDQLIIFKTDTIFWKLDLFLRSQVKGCGHTYWFGSDI